MNQLGTGQQEFEGPMEFISLAQLLKHSQIYERMPQLIQAGLRRSVWLTLSTELILLALFMLVPLHVWLTPVQAGGFFIEPMIGVTNTLLNLVATIVPYLVLVTLINLFFTLLILSLSLFMLLPVREPIHWLAALNSLPCWINIIVMGTFAVLVSTLVVVNIVLWVVLGVISIAITIVVALAIFYVAAGILGSIFR
jgi:hypothetical protein